MDKKFGSPLITNDGVTIAKEIELPDPFENMGTQLIKEVSTKTNDVAGDGTTTATLLAQAIIHEGLKNVAAGANPMVMKRGIQAATKAAVDAIHANSQPVSGSKDIARVGTISSGDQHIGKLIAEGRCAQGDAGRMGGGPEYLLALRPGARFSIQRLGRLYGAPGRLNVEIAEDGTPVLTDAWAAIKAAEADAAWEVT